VVSRCAIRRGGRSGGGSKDGCRVRARETVFGFRFQNGENNDGVSRDEWIGRSGFPFSPREGIKGKQN